MLTLYSQKSQRKLPQKTQQTEGSTIFIGMTTMTTVQVQFKLIQH